MVRETPLSENRATARDNTGHALGRQRDIAQQYTSMDGKIIDSLFGLLDEGVAEDLPREFLSFAIYFFQSLIDGHGTDRHRRVAQNPLSRLVDVLTGGQVHDRVSSPACRPDHLF